MLKKMLLGAAFIVALSTGSEAKSVFVFQQVYAPPVYGYHYVEPVRYAPVYRPAPRPQCHRERYYAPVNHRNYDHPRRHGGYNGGHNRHW